MSTEKTKEKDLTKEEYVKKMIKSLKYEDLEKTIFYIEELIAQYNQ